MSEASANGHFPELNAFDTVNLHGLDLLATTEAQCVDLVVTSAAEGRGGWIVTPNLDILRQCTLNPGLKSMVQSADARVADGMPLIWAARLQGTPLPERVAGSSLVEPICAGFSRQGLSVFLLGGAPGVVEKTQSVLLEKLPDLKIAGTYCPPFGFEQDEAELARIHTSLRDSHADLVFVALGFPKGERLIARLRSELPKAWWIGVGISFSFVAGDVKRAPVWMQKSGLEWVYRLWQEPRRLARRYLIEDLPFSVRLFARALWRRLRPEK